MTPTPDPDSPDWPCRTGAMGTLPGRLVTALYLLTRDHVLPGDMEQVLLKVAPYNDVRCTYTNPHLHQLARSHAQFLLTEAEAEESDAKLPYADVMNVQVYDGMHWEGGEVPVEIGLGADDGTEELKLDITVGHITEPVAIRFDIDRLQAIINAARKAK